MLFLAVVIHSYVRYYSLGSPFPQPCWLLREYRFCNKIRINTVCNAVYSNTLKLSYRSSEFLMLENVISRYRCPSILDLKMGTQIHSDSKTSEEEMKRRRSKWEKTTARTLGVRLGGMKVYTDFPYIPCTNKLG